MVGEGRSGGKPLGSDADDFLDWLAHHHELTGIGIPGAKTKRFKELRVRYWAIRKQEDFTADDLKLATVGAFADQWRRDNGYVGHWNILRFKAVPQLIEKGRGTGTGNMTMRGREQAAVSLRRTPKQQAVALWTTEVFALCNDATTGPDSLDEIDPAMPFKPKTKAEARAKLADYGLDVDTLLADYTKHRRNGGFPDRDAWVLTTTGRSTAP